MYVSVCVCVYVCMYKRVCLGVKRKWKMKSKHLKRHIRWHRILPVTARLPLLATLFAAAIGLALDPCYLCVIRMQWCLCPCVPTTNTHTHGETLLATCENVCTMKPFQLFSLTLLGTSSEFRVGSWERGSGVYLHPARNFSLHFEIGTWKRNLTAIHATAAQNYKYTHRHSPVLPIYCKLYVYFPLSMLLDQLLSMFGSGKYYTILIT